MTNVNNIVHTKLVDEYSQLVPLGNKSIQVRTKSTDSKVVYVGFAAMGSATSDAVWQIMQVDTNTGVSVKYADGNDHFNNIFDNRESLTYV